jgi:hypothetical protein
VVNANLGISTVQISDSSNRTEMHESSKRRVKELEAPLNNRLRVVSLVGMGGNLYRSLLSP